MDLLKTVFELGIPQILFGLVLILGFAPVLVWAERRQSAMIQDRVGPHRASITLPMADVRMVPIVAGTALFGAALSLLADVITSGPEGLRVRWWTPALAVLAVLLFGVGAYLRRVQGVVRVLGLIHPLADALKMMWKEDFVPPKADKLLHTLAPMIALVPAILSLAVIPFAGDLHLEHLLDNAETLPSGARGIPLQIASINLGILFLFAIAGTGIVGAAIAGYSSDNKYSLLGGLRAAGQMVSYEVTLGLTLVPVFMVFGTLLPERMVDWQGEHLWGLVPRWGIFFPTLTVAFVLYLAAAIAETKRVPFDVPEGESEIVGGYFTEYSGMKFGMFFMSEFIEVVVLGALAVTLFFGGYHVPWLHEYGFSIHVPLVQDPGVFWEVPLPHGAVVAIQLVAFVAKVVALMWLQLQLRWTLPRFRYDQIMAVCWKYLLPASLANIFVTGLLLLVVPYVRHWFQ